MAGKGRPDVTHHRFGSLEDIFEGEAVHDSAERREISTTFGIPLALAGRRMCTLTLYFDNQRGGREVEVNSGNSLTSPAMHHLAPRAWQPIEPTQTQELPLKFVCTPGINEDAVQESDAGSAAGTQRGQPLVQKGHRGSAVPDRRVDSIFQLVLQTASNQVDDRPGWSCARKAGDHATINQGNNWHRMHHTGEGAIPKPARRNHFYRAFREAIETMESSSRAVADESAIASFVQRGT